jgi:hypothetical protein
VQNGAGCTDQAVHGPLDALLVLLLPEPRRRRSRHLQQRRQQRLPELLLKVDDLGAQDPLLVRQPARRAREVTLRVAAVFQDQRVAGHRLVLQRHLAGCRRKAEADRLKLDAVLVEEDPELAEWARLPRQSRLQRLQRLLRGRVVERREVGSQLHQLDAHLRRPDARHTHRHEQVPECRREPLSLAAGDPKTIRRRLRPLMHRPLRPAEHHVDLVHLLVQIRCRVDRLANDSHEPGRTQERAGRERDRAAKMRERSGAGERATAEAAHLLVDVLGPAPERVGRPPERPLRRRQFAVELRRVRRQLDGRAAGPARSGDRHLAAALQLGQPGVMLLRLPRPDVRQFDPRHRSVVA